MENKINVCMISGAYPPCRDGIGDYTARLIDGLRKENIKVSLITSEEEQISEYVRKNNIENVFPIIKRWNIFAVLAILKFAAEGRFDVIHLQFPSSRYKRTFSLCFLPILLGLFLRKKTVVTLHEFSISYPINKLRQIILGLGSSKVILTDNNEIKKFPAGFIAGKRKICFIPIGSNIDIYGADSGEKEEFFKKTGLSRQAKIITFFGFIHSNKGLNCLLKAVKKVEAYGIPAQLLVMSQLDFKSNAYHAKVKKLIGALGLDKTVFITGYLSPEEVSRFLSFSDICALPFSDGATLRRGTLMAALSHGKAVISTRAGRNDSSQLIDRENILLVPSGNAHALAEAIKNLCTDGGLRRKIEEGAFHLSKDFSWDKITCMHKELYSELTGIL
ncbi:MAG: glycosyltransferase [Candidatus Omnitrophica bacterium]|nr:glycosyltransferase [Candidatus Omnitrophota bacterium]